jgi:hypothetical protein
MEQMAIRTLFLLNILRDFSEGSQGPTVFFPLGPWASGGFRKFVLSETAGAGALDTLA